VHTEEAQLCQLRDNFRGKSPALVVVRDYGKEPVVDEATNRGSNQSLLLAQQVIDAIKINERGQSDLIV